MTDYTPYLFPVLRDSRLTPKGEKKTQLDKVETIGDQMIKIMGSENLSASFELKKFKVSKRVPEKNTFLDGVILSDKRKIYLSKKEQPWVRLKKLKPHFQELLIDLFLILEGRNISLEKNTLVELAITLAKSKNSESVETLGMLLFLVSNHQDFEIGLAETSKIKDRFLEKINEVQKNLKNHYQEHKIIALQSPEIALMTQLPNEIAILLLTEIGTVNIGIIPALINHFVENAKTPKNYEINLMTTFKELCHSASLREKISEISSPEVLRTPINRIIRAVLDLPLNITPTPLHAKQAALSALLSHIRQGTEGSCFATPLIIWLLTCDLSQCANDLNSLLTYGKITRKIHQEKRDFPFIPRIANKTINKSFILSRTGHIIGSDGPKGYLWDVPGFVKACKAINIENYNEALLSIIAPIFEDIKTNETEVTVRTVLKHLAKHFASEKESAGTLYINAYLSFEGQISNPLLGIWENAIAGMAEADETSMVTAAVLDSITTVILKNFKGARKKLKPYIKTELTKRIHFQYDPIVSHSNPGILKNTTEGAFVLYDKGGYKQSSSWTRVSNPEDFQSFISRILESIQNRIEENEPELSKNIFLLTEFVMTNDFLIQILNHYYPANVSIEDPIKDYKQIHFAPWTTKSGNNFSKVVQVYFEAKQNNSELKLIKNPKILLEKILELERKNPHQKRVLVRIPGIHAFSIFLDHPTLKLIPEESKISEMILSPEIKADLIKYALKEFVSKKNKLAFTTQIETLKKDLSIREFRTYLNSLITRLESKEPDFTLFDGFLYNLLPTDLKEQMDKQAIHFADTNWSNGFHDVHFCFVVNPGTGELEVWTSLDNRTQLEPINQFRWLQDWEIIDPSSHVFC